MTTDDLIFTRLYETPDPKYDDEEVQFSMFFTFISDNLFSQQSVMWIFWTSICDMKYKFLLLIHYHTNTISEIKCKHFDEMIELFNMQARVIEHYDWH